MKIIFTKIKFKNLLSYGNKETIYNFQNGIDIISAKNGSGKSTVIDAITFALFGKPFRKIKMGSLINNKNNKNLLVELDFQINNNKFKIKRGQKPNIFEIYKFKDSYELIPQNSTIKEYQKQLEKTILFFNENVYRQLIALGANLSLSKDFMELSAREKEEIFQIITDTTIFTKLKEKIKEKTNLLKTQVTEYNYKIDMTQSSIFSLQENIKQMEEQNKKIKENKDQILENLNKKLKEKQTLLKDIYNKIEKIKIFKEKYLKLQSERDILIQQKQTLSEIILKLEVKIKMKNDNIVVCNNCNHKIHLNPIEENIEENLIKNKDNLLEVENKLNPIEEKFNKLKRILLLSKNVFNDKKTLEREINNINEEIKKVNEWEFFDINYQSLNKMNEDLANFKTKFVKITERLENYKRLENLILSDDLKGMILSRQIPILNKYINEFLLKFNSEFNFVIDTNFKEKIIYRGKEREFNSLSNGQKQRITISILFSFLKLIEARNGISTNLLVLDEYLDSSLDIDGTEEALRIINNIFSDNKNIILITHNPDIKNKQEYINRSFTIERKYFSELKEIRDF